MLCVFYTVYLNLNKSAQLSLTALPSSEKITNYLIKKTTLRTNSYNLEGLLNKTTRYSEETKARSCGMKLDLWENGKGTLP